MEIQPKEPPESVIPRNNTPDPSWEYAELWNQLENTIHYLFVTKGLISQQEYGTPQMDDILTSRINQSISHLLYIRKMGEK